MHSRFRLLAAMLAVFSLALGNGVAAAHQGTDPFQSSAAEIPTTRLNNVACEDGMAGPFPCRDLDLVAFIPKGEFGVEFLEGSGFTGMSEAWGWTDPDNGDEYAIFGVSNGVHFVRINETDPEYLGYIPNTAAAQLIWYDMKVVGNTLYSVSESAPHNVRTFDLTNLRGAAADPPFPAKFVEGLRYLPDFSSHNFAVNEDTNRGYVVGGNVGLVVPDNCFGGLITLDLSTPLTPTPLGCYDADGYVHDTQCVTYAGPDTEHTGKEICLNSAEDIIAIIDNTDPGNVARLGEVTYEFIGYTHQGWLSEDHSLFFVGDETDETDFDEVTNTRTLIIDVTDLDNPTLINIYEHATTSIDHNMYVHDGLLYQSNYTAGLRVLDISRARQGLLDEVAFFDVFPDNDDPIFAGTWGNYPFFESGIIPVTSSDEGLFLVRRSAAATEPEPAPSPSGSATGGVTDPTVDPAPTHDELPATGGGFVLPALGLVALALRRRRDDED